MHVTNRFNQRPLLKETGGMLGMLFQMEPHLSITTLSIIHFMTTSSNKATFILNCWTWKLHDPNHFQNLIFLVCKQNKFKLSFLGELARLCHSKGEARYNTEKDLRVHSFQWSSLGVGQNPVKFIGILVGMEKKNTCEQKHGIFSCI